MLLLLLGPVLRMLPVTLLLWGPGLQQAQQPCWQQVLTGH
jgi:hypothetical protein